MKTITRYSLQKINLNNIDPKQILKLKRVFNKIKDNFNIYLSIYNVRYYIDIGNNITYHRKRKPEHRHIIIHTYYTIKHKGKILPVLSLYFNEDATERDILEKLSEMYNFEQICKVEKII